jgi:phospholipid/cholesterol/gamma-HCH transport system substrate-binding protein
MELSQQMRVGLFLVAGIGGLLFSIFFLGGEDSVFTKNALLYGKMPHVQGLNPGSLVSLAGVPIGNIQAITFAKDGSGIVLEMKIKEKFLAEVRKGSTIETRTQGALGDKFIYIEPSSAENPPHVEGDFIAASTSQDLMGVISEKGSEAAKIFDVISETLKLLQTMNAGNKVDVILTNFKEASIHTKEMSLEAKALIAELRSKDSNVQKSMARLNAILEKVDKGDGTLGALINDPTLHNQLKALLGGGQKKQNLRSILQDTISESDK